MNKAPNLYNLKELIPVVNGDGPMSEDKNGDWVPARPLGLFSLRRRIKLAWGVLTGKYDALKWPSGQ